MKQVYKDLRYTASIGWNDHLWQIPEELLQEYSDLIIRACLGKIENENDRNKIKEIFSIDQGS